MVPLKSRNGNVSVSIVYATQMKCKTRTFFLKRKLRSISALTDFLFVYVALCLAERPHKPENSM